MLMASAQPLAFLLFLYLNNAHFQGVVQILPVQEAPPVLMNGHLFPTPFCSAGLVYGALAQSSASPPAAGLRFSWHFCCYILIVRI